MRQRTEQEDFWQFTDEEMETAKNTDLPDLLEHLGYHLKREGHYYTTREMDSLCWAATRVWPSPSPAIPLSPGCWCSRPP